MVEFFSYQNYVNRPSQEKTPTTQHEDDIIVEEEFDESELYNRPSEQPLLTELAIAKNASREKQRRCNNLVEEYGKIAAELDISLAVETNSQTREWLNQLLTLALLQKNRASKLSQIYRNATNAKDLFEYDEAREPVNELEADLRIGKKLLSEEMDSLKSKLKPDKNAEEIIEKQTREKAVTQVVRDLGESINDSDLTFSALERRYQERLRNNQRPELAEKERANEYQEIATNLNQFIEQLNTLNAEFGISAIPKFSWIEGERPELSYFKFAKNLETRLHLSYGIILQKARREPPTVITSIYKKYIRLASTFDRFSDYLNDAATREKHYEQKFIAPPSMPSPIDSNRPIASLN